MSQSKLEVYKAQYKDLEKLESLEKIDKVEESDNKNVKPINQWKDYHENILVDWADKASCYRWLHAKSCSKYTRLRNLYTIPVIILSTLTGTANFAQDRFPENMKSLVQICIGSLNILAGIITTVSQFLKINELTEAHRVSSISWDKFYRNIKVELIKSPYDRTDVNYIIKQCKDEYDRLIETSPTIDQAIIAKFKTTFNIKEIDTKVETIKVISKPEILDSIESTKNIVYKTTKEEIERNSMIEIIKNKKEEISKENIIENFIETFTKEYSREPSIIEIYDNLESKVDNKVIEQFFTKSKWLNRNKNKN